MTEDPADRIHKWVLGLPARRVRGLELRDGSTTLLALEYSAELATTLQLVDAAQSHVAETEKTAILRIVAVGAKGPLGYIPMKVRSGADAEKARAAEDTGARDLLRQAHAHTEVLVKELVGMAQALTRSVDAQLSVAARQTEAAEKRAREALERADAAEDTVRDALALADTATAKVKEVQTAQRGDPMEELARHAVAATVMTRLGLPADLVGQVLGRDPESIKKLTTPLNGAPKGEPNAG